VVAGQADHALDVVDVRMLRIDEDHHVAALGGPLPELVHFPGVGERDPQPVAHLVDEDEVADEQRGDHRARGDVEGLEEEGAEEERHQDGAADGLGVLAHRPLAGKGQVLVQGRVESVAGLDGGHSLGLLQRVVHAGDGRLHLGGRAVGDLRPVAAQEPAGVAAQRLRLVSRPAAHAPGGRGPDGGEHEHRQEHAERAEQEILAAQEMLGEHPSTTVPATMPASLP